jgi:hypothetical protein
MTFGDDSDLENEEMDSLQSYARKGMAQEMAKKLGLLGDVPGAAEDAPQGDTGDMKGDDVGDKPAAGEDIPPELLEAILAKLA